MSTYTCPWVVNHDALGADAMCGAEATAIEINPATGEIEVACEAHVDNLGAPGYVVVRTNGAIHSTGMHTTDA